MSGTTDLERRRRERAAKAAALVEVILDEFPDPFERALAMRDVVAGVIASLGMDPAGEIAAARLLTDQVADRLDASRLARMAAAGAA